MIKEIYKQIFLYHYLRYKKYGRTHPEINSSIYTWFLYSLDLMCIFLLLLYFNVIPIANYNQIIIIVALVIFTVNEIYLRRNKFFTQNIQGLQSDIILNRFLIIVHEYGTIGLLLLLVWLNHK